MTRDEHGDDHRKVDPFFTFEREGMLRYFSSFDPIEYRYNIADTFRKREGDLREMVWGRNKEKTQLEDQRRMIYSQIVRYEKSRSQTENMSADSNDILKNLRLIYGESDPIMDYIRVYEVVQRKLISGYLRIDGLTSLFHQKYFEFEWLQHTGLNYKNHTQSFYRDHFIHQAKVTYEAMRFLVKMPSLQDNIVKAFSKDNTVVANYIRKAAENEFSAVAGEPDARAIYEDLYESKFNFSQGFTAETEPLAYRHIYKNIIKSALIMAGLFHDIGYPIQYVNENKEQLPEFLPTAHFFFDPALHWDDMLGKLSDSLLRKIIPYDRLKSALEAQLHGTLSALAFLLYFYENGSIYCLRPAKRAAVELAALAMADHTNRFNILKDPNSDYYRITSYKNPLSFLLRFSDDIQEWDRTYFLVSSNDNDSTRCCTKCGCPVIRCDYTYEQTTMRRHLCGCRTAGKTEDEAVTYFLNKLQEGRHDEGDAYTSIPGVPYRRLNHVSISERVRVFRVAPKSEAKQRSYFLDFLPGYENKSIDDATNENSTGEREAYIVQVDFTLYRMLQIAFVQPDFARHRAEVLNRLKILLNDNKYFPTTLIFSEITTNPITLKVKILERFISNLRSRFMLSCEIAGISVVENEQKSRKLESLRKKLEKCCEDIDDGVEKLPESIFLSESGKLDNNLQNKMRDAFQIDMLLFANKRFTISEIENTVNVAKKRAGEERRDTDQEMKDIENSMIFTDLMKLRSSKSLEKDTVGLKREYFCCLAVAVYNRMREFFDIDNRSESSPSTYLNTLLDTVFDGCTDIIIKECANVENAIYDKVLQKPSDADVAFIRNIVKDEPTNELTGQFCDNLINRIMRLPKNDENKTKISENLALYFRLLIASKLFVLAKRIVEEKRKTNDAQETLVRNSFDNNFEIKAAVFLKHVYESVVEYFTKNEDLIRYFPNEHSGDKSLEILIKDFFTQESRHIAYYDHALHNKPLPKEYYEVYSQPGEVEKAIAKYTDTNNYKRAIYDKEHHHHFEAHIDLYVFTRMAHAVQ